MVTSMGTPAAQAVADQLVEGIVPADILARRNDIAGRVAMGGGVHGAGLGIERLVGADRLQRAEDRGGLDPPRPRQSGQRPQRLLQILDAAQPAGGFGGPVPDPGEHPVVPLRHQLDAEQHAPFLLADLNADDVRRAVDQPLRPGEALGEILQVGRRRHHHRIADAEDADGDRRLQRHRPVPVGRAPVRAHPPRRDGDAGECGRGRLLDGHGDART